MTSSAAAAQPNRAPAVARPLAGLQAAPSRRYRNRTMAGRLLAQPLVVAAGAALILIAATAAAAPWVAPYGYDDQNLKLILKAPSWAPGGAADHLLGTDQLGRDILSRVIFGARVSLAMGAAAVIFGGTLGVAIGLLAGYFGRTFDNLVMRLADIQLAFPYLLLAIAVIAVIGTEMVKLIGVLGLRSWIVHARVVRGSVLSLKEMEYVQAARALGAGHARILARHILPNALAPLIVISTAELAQLILLESTLSFLGLGVQPPTPSWGEMLSSGRAFLTMAWWLALFPGLAIMVTVLLVSIVGDGVRDAFDPRMNR